MPDYDDGYDDSYDDEEDDWREEWDGDPCSQCGPSCEEWGGDGLCMLAIEHQANEAKEYEAEYVYPNISCPVCQKSLTEYQIPSDELWTWGADFFNPMIALGIYAVLDAPKGELHRHENICHIWIGEGERRDEKLIRLLGKDQPPYHHALAVTNPNELPF